MGPLTDYRSVRTAGWGGPDMRAISDCTYQTAPTNIRMATAPMRNCTTAIALSDVLMGGGSYAS